MDGCTCRCCKPYSGLFVVCRECGSKRCPKATDHYLECTKSNDPGQAGSVYGPEDQLSGRYLKTHQDRVENKIFRRLDAGIL